MFASRLLGAGQALGVPISIVAQQAALTEKLTGDCKLLLIDLSLDRLDLSAAIAAVRAAAPKAQVVAFGAHVNEAALAAAEAAGCDLVLPRWQFHKQYTEMLRGAL
jgi:DNA-binding NarL/FixJ family response regulator